MMPATAIQCPECGIWLTGLSAGDASGLLREHVMWNHTETEGERV